VEGDFELRGLPEDMPLELRAGKSGWTFPQPIPVALVGAPDVQLTLYRTTEVRYRVVDDATGEAVQAAFTMLRQPGGLAHVPEPWRRLEGFWRGEDVTATGWTVLTFRTPREREREGHDAEDLRCEVHVHAPGYEDAVDAFVVVLGDTVEREIHVRRKRGGVLQPVHFSARLRAGGAFSGRLELAIVEIEGSGPYSMLNMDFMDGQAAVDVRLPAGTYKVVPRGATDAESMIWWHPAGDGAVVEVDGVRGTIPCQLLLHGTRVVMDVQTSDGHRVRGFDLHVESSQSRVSGGRAGWDARLLWSAGEARRDEPPPPLLWLAPGQATITASLPGIGSCAKTVVVPEGPESYVVPMVLVPVK
jgi:hypothetical protein